MKRFTRAGLWGGALVPLLLAAGCADDGGPAQGLLQPQAVTGPCHVQKFFLLRLDRSYSHMTVDNTAQTCRLTLINPALQFVQNAALITQPATHGQAAAELINGGQSAAVTYMPVPGYVGDDSFTVTVQPDAKTVTFRVVVQTPQAR